MSGALLPDVWAQLQASDDDVRIVALAHLTTHDIQVPIVKLKLLSATQ